MPLWFQTETRVRTHPKMVRAGRAACWTWLAGNCYAKDQMTDGFIPEGMLASLVPGASMREIKKDADALVAVGLWETTEGGYQIHDYLHYNDSKAAILVKRQKDLNRKKRSTSDSVEIPDGKREDSLRPLSIPLSKDLDPEGGPGETAAPPAVKPMRQPVQGRGAFGAGSLPRDHATKHAVCGPTWRICLTHWEFGELVRQYGAAESEARPAIESFVDRLEKALGPQHSPGGFKGIEKEFQVYLRSIGRLSDLPRLGTAAPIWKSKHDQVLDDIDKGKYARG